MKKFSTAGLILAFASTVASLPAWAADAGTETANTPRCEFLANAPDQHVVVRGDTLWGISGKFLQHPWCWPQVWGLNRDQIRNPHWIYPGQIVYFDRTAGRLRLGKPTGSGREGSLSDVRLSPQVRMEGLGRDAIPAIPINAIEPFLSQPLIIEENELKDAPRIVATQEGHVFLGKNDKAYVRGDLKGGTSFQVFRPGSPLRDPSTQAIIGYEAAYLGTVKLDRAAKTADEAHRFIVVTSKEEMGVGDQLLPVPPSPILNYVPHAPEKQIDARIVSVYGGVTQAGQNNIVSINRGKKDDIDVGTVLQLYRFGQIIADPTDNKKPVKLPDEQYGTLFIFRIFNNISYGLVMQVTDAVQVGDVAKSPE
ncbi:MAG: LysM peptidoglycan-binding protein [Herminiimonas sp.]|nr:LysM peptidoglycan-binding protein [Herminiimonas sp.]